MSSHNETIMKKFTKYPNQGLGTQTMKVLTGEMLNGIYHTFTSGEIEKYVDEWGHFGEEGSTEALFLVFQEVFNYEIDSEFKISAIEDYLLLMLLDFRITHNGIPATTEGLAALVQNLKKQYRIGTNVCLSVNLNSLINPPPPNEYQKLIIDWMLQLRDAVQSESESKTSALFFPHGFSMN